VLASTLSVTVLSTPPVAAGFGRPPPGGPAPDATATTGSEGQRSRAQLGLRFWGLWTATGVSRLGDGLVTVALPLLAATMTSDGLKIGAMVAALRLPWLVFALPFGAWADRVDRRRIAACSEAARMLLLTLFGVVVTTHIHRLSILYVFAFFMGIFEVLTFAATASAVPDLVAQDQLPAANGHLSAIDRACSDFIGVAVGGFVFAWFAAGPFALDGLSFGLSAVILLAILPGPRGSNPRHARVGRVPTEDLPPADRESLRRSIEEGITYVRSSPPLRLLASTIAVLAVCQTMVGALLVLFGLNYLHLSRSSYGLFVGMAAVGAVAGGLLASRIIARLGKATTLVLGAFLAGLAYLSLAATRSVAIAFLALLVEIFGITIGNVATLSIRHERIPSRMMGRTSTAFRMVALGAVPVGALLGGLIAHVSSPRASIVVAGVVQVVAIAVLAPRIRQILADPSVDLRRDPAPSPRERLDVPVGVE